MCSPFDSCWIYIKPTSKCSDSPFIGVVAAVDSRFEFPKTSVDSGSCVIYSKARQFQLFIAVISSERSELSNMAASPRAPKQWQLTKIEMITSYKSWGHNLIYLLSLYKNFVPCLDATWQKQTATNPRRGLTNDGTAVPEAQRLTAIQKNAHLDLLLGQIANFCSVISRNSIVKHSTSLNDLWQKICQHYGFQSTGVHFLDLASICLQPDERPEDLFQRLMAFFEDNLLSIHGSLTHHRDAATSDLSPNPDAAPSCPASSAKLPDTHIPLTT